MKPPKHYPVIASSAMVVLLSVSCIEDATPEEFCDAHPEDCWDEERGAAVPIPGMVASGAYASHTFFKTTNYRYTVCINVTSGNADLYGHYTGSPTTASYQFKSTNTGTSDDCFSFDATSNGTYYISIYGNGAASSYSYRVTSTPKFNPPAALNEALEWPLGPSHQALTYSAYGPFNSPWGNPSNAPKLNPFFPGKKNWIHNGVDVSVPPTTQVNAACSGKIKKKGSLGSSTIGGVSYPWGYYALQECNVGGTVITVAYDHLNEAGIPGVDVTVNKGAKIGTIFNLSVPGEKDHLHLGICKSTFLNCEGMTQAGAMPDTSFSSLMLNPYNASLYSNIP